MSVRRSVFHLLQVYPWSRARRPLALLGLATAALLAPSRLVTARAQSLPRDIEPGRTTEFEGDSEKIEGPFPGLLLIPRDKQNAHEDERTHALYAGACGVYVAERVTGSSEIAGYSRRFVVHVSDASMAPLMKRAARLLLLLLGEVRTRFRYDHPPNETTVDVWLSNEPHTGGADVGGEQFKSQIIVYSAMSDRTPIEWARELAHEYGHYALPGVSGFTAPEEWANGVLGERLFLKWLHEDLGAGRLKPADVPFAPPEAIGEYIDRQVTPLVRRVARDGIEPQLLGRKDAPGMDYYTGFALYLDSVYGSSALMDAMSYTAPADGSTLVRASDFYRGALTSLGGATEITVTAPFVTASSRSESFLVYVPRGRYAIAEGGAARGWQFAADARTISPQRDGELTVNRPDWIKLTLKRGPGVEGVARLTLRRKGAEVP